MKKRGAVVASCLFLIGVHLVLLSFKQLPPYVSAYPLYLTYLIGGLPLFIDLFRGITQKKIGTDVLAGIAVLSAALMGEFLAGSVIIVMFSGGSALEAYALTNASSVLSTLAKRAPSVAHRRKQDQLADIRVEQIEPGDLLEIFPHEICPADGEVVSGHSTMDEAYLTGEPYTIDKAPGSFVISGAINGDECLTIRASRKASESRYAKILDVVKESENNKPQIRRLSEKIGVLYAPLALCLAVTAALASGEVKRFLAVLAVATPCPLIIGIPVAVLGAISGCAKRSIIIKNPVALEEVTNCRTAIFDKTGTLTYGQPEFSEIVLLAEASEEHVLAMAASLERYSKHPLAAALLEEAKSRKIALDEVAQIRENPGYGLCGQVLGHAVEVMGRRSLTETEKKLIPGDSAGLECVVRIEGRLTALIRFRDKPKMEGNFFIRHLRPRHQFQKVLIVSGDRDSEVRNFAGQIGISKIYSEKSPEQKLAIVKDETAQAKTLFVGDGINDAPALMQATVGVAIGKNSDVAGQSSKVVIMDHSLEKVDEFLHISSRFKRIALQTAIGGVILSLIGMIAAAFGYLTPVAGALVQEGIDLFAVLNAFRCAAPPKALSDFAAKP